MRDMIAVSLHVFFFYRFCLVRSVHVKQRGKLMETPEELSSRGPRLKLAVYQQSCQHQDKMAV